jgi:adenylate cyclase
MAIALNGWSESDHKAIREQLDRILKSGPFHQSRRRQRFLEYIVNETLAGHGDRLKGYNVALAVFDRAETFDSNIDPIVRMEAVRLRDRLREYYETDGQRDPIRIGLPKGTYTPHIEFRQAATFDALPDGPDGLRAVTQDQSPNLAKAPTAVVDDQVSLAPARSERRVRWQIIVPALVLISMLGVASAWFTRDLWMPTVPEGAAENPVIGAPKGPAIAVLPFNNLSGDPKQDYFSDGLTEDILTELSRARDLRVLARNTSFRFKGQAVDVRELGHKLGVGYVLEGSIQRTDDRLRVTAQLIDTETGTHIWADRYDREMADVFLVQDEIVSKIVAKLASGYGVIESSEAKSAARKSPDQIQAYDLVLRARDVMGSAWNRETFRSAKEFLRKAIALDPANARAIREAAWIATIGRAFRLDETPTPPEEIIAQANKTVQLDPGDARARMVAASAYFYNGQLDLFEQEAQAAMALDPYDAEIPAIFGYMVAISGQWRRGVALAQKANALNPDTAAGWYHTTLSLDSYLHGDYQRALELTRQDPGRQSAYLYVRYISIYGELGRKQEALENWRKLLAEQPGWSAESFETWWHTRNMRDQDIAKLMDGVYKSGVLGVEALPGQ